ncbi:MAG: hypothetical protein AB8F34_15850 [Akkermansiaceae bacterium]
MSNRDEKAPHDPKLKVLDEQSQTPPVEKIEKLTAHESEVVEVLKPDREARHDAKTFKPEVADILDAEEEKIDTEENWGINTIKVPPIGWFVLAGILLVGLGVWGAMNVYNAQPELETVDREKDELEQKRAEDAIKVKKTLAALEHAVAGYLGAERIEDKLKFVRHAKRVEPLMRKYYTDESLNAVQYEHIERTRSLGLETRSFVYAKVVLSDGRKKSLVLQQLEDELFVVDWESDVCYQPINWETYIKERPTEAQVMRVKIKGDNYHVYEFRDEETFDCYRLTAKGSQNHLFGFVRKGSPVARELVHFAEKNGLNNEAAKAQPLMLKIRFPKDSPSKKCVWIEQMVAPRWLLVDSPSEE